MGLLVSGEVIRCSRMANGGAVCLFVVFVVFVYWKFTFLLAGEPWHLQ